MNSGQELKLNSGMKCAKYMLLVVSLMFAITAILLVLVGGTIQAIFGDFRQFVYDRYLSPPNLLISIGFLLLVVAIFGAYGAIRESVMLINLYGLCLFMIFLLEITASITAFVMQSQVQQMLQYTMNQSLAEYQNGNVNLQRGVDFMQSTLKCCGVLSEEDWDPYYNESMANSITDVYQHALPKSCCKDFASDLATCNHYYENGCFHQLHFIIAQSTMLISTGATTVAFVQLLGSICAFMLAKTLRRHKSIREARRWQYQQSLGILIAGNKMGNAIANNNFHGYTQLDNWVLRPQDQEVITYTENSPNVN